MQGYENHPFANQAVCTGGWFRTGDQGFLDAEGYLFITGRVKEMINSGGEKIAPQEVEQVLLDYPAVAQALAFAVPHPQLGEELAAAVVLQPHTVALASGIRAFAATRLAAFKVPRQVYIVEELPRSALGKLQRLHVAETLGLTVSAPRWPARAADSAAPRTPVEEILVGLWSQVFRLERVSVHDDFFALGGDSLLATQMLHQMQELTSSELSFLSFFETPTIAGLAQRIETAYATGQPLVHDTITPIRRTADTARLYGPGTVMVSRSDVPRHVFFQYLLSRAS